MALVDLGEAFVVTSITTHNQIRPICSTLIIESSTSRVAMKTVIHTEWFRLHSRDQKCGFGAANAPLVVTASEHSYVSDGRCPIEMYSDTGLATFGVANSSPPHVHLSSSRSSSVVSTLQKRSIGVNRTSSLVQQSALSQMPDNIY